MGRHAFAARHAVSGYAYVRWEPDYELWMAMAPAAARQGQAILHRKADGFATPWEAAAAVAQWRHEQSNSSNSSNTATDTATEVVMEGPRRRCATARFGADAEASEAALDEVCGSSVRRPNRGEALASLISPLPVEERVVHVEQAVDRFRHMMVRVKKIFVAAGWHKKVFAQFERDAKAECLEAFVATLACCANRFCCYGGNCPNARAIEALETPCERLTMFDLDHGKEFDSVMRSYVATRRRACHRSGCDFAAAPWDTGINAPLMLHFLFGTAPAVFVGADGESVTIPAPIRLKCSHRHFGEQACHTIPPCMRRR